MIVLGFLESETVLDEYELATRLGKLFPSIEIEELENLSFSPSSEIGPRAWLPGSDEYDVLAAKINMPQDDPATAEQLRDLAVSPMVIDAVGKPRAAGYAPVDGMRYHSFVAELSKTQ